MVPHRRKESEKKMTIFETIQKRFPVRNTPEEKEAFREFTLDFASGMGWNARTEDDSRHLNIVFGDPERAETVFTAHYDTPRRSLFPNLMMPCARRLSFLYQIGIVLLLLVVPTLAALWLFYRLIPLDYGAVSGRLALLGVYFLVYFGLFLLFFKGRKNPHNANDNTSGVATVMEILLAVPEEKRGKVAAILFDDEEKGKQGSKVFASAHQSIKKSTRVVNFDCVGLGNHFVVIENKSFNLKDESFREAFGMLSEVIFRNGKKARANSDHHSFDQGITVLTCKKSSQGILYADRIHTPKDTEVSEENIHQLCDVSIRYIEKL